jgi:hypothetical protein
MPSQLVGFFPPRRLSWNEFKGNPTTKELEELRRIAAGHPNMTVGMAGTYSSFTVNFGGSVPSDPVLTSIPGSSPATFALADTIVATVNFDGARSWKQIGPLSLKGEQLLLDHEQGHFDLTALIARDCFIDLMQLKAKTFPSRQAGQAEANQIVADYQSKLSRIQTTYDKDTTHGAWVTPYMAMMAERKESFQNKWEGFIQRARTEKRQPQVIAPDGSIYLVPLLKVLDDGGFLFPSVPPRP